jgi:hypothetical protein
VSGVCWCDHPRAAHRWHMMESRCAATIVVYDSRYPDSHGFIRYSYPCPCVCWADAIDSRTGEPEASP